MTRAVAGVEVGDFDGFAGDGGIAIVVAVRLRRLLGLELVRRQRRLVLLRRQHEGVAAFATAQRQLQDARGRQPVIALSAGEHGAGNGTVVVAKGRIADAQNIVARSPFQMQIGQPVPRTGPPRNV